MNGARRKRSSDVFGNLARTARPASLFTRDPLARKRFYGEFLNQRPGEDVVAGIRTPKPIAELSQALPKPQLGSGASPSCSNELL